MTNAQTRHPRKQSLFALLSLADFSLTWLLLSGTRGGAYEANPIAGWWLDRHGWAGLACFKAGTVALVLILSAAVSRSRPLAAGRVLWLGCACLAGVIGYSVALCGVAFSADSVEDVRRHVDRLNAESRERQRGMAPFRALLAEVRKALLEDRCTLLEAADRLAEMDVARDRDRLSALTPLDRDGPLTRRLACLAAGNALGSLREPAEIERIFYRLDEEYRSAFGSPLPSHLRHYSGAVAWSRRRVMSGGRVGQAGRPRGGHGGYWGRPPEQR